MNLFQLFKSIVPYVRRYKMILFLALFLTLLGSFTAQVNAIVLRYTVDEVTLLVQNAHGLSAGLPVLLVISAVLLIKEVLNIFIKFGQQYFGQELRIFISRDLSDAVMSRVLSYQMRFFSSDDNESGKLQTRIDRGVSSLTRLVQNFFISILPLFAGSVVALILMFHANVWVGLVGLCIVPVYVIIIVQQAKKLSGRRRDMRQFFESKNQGIVSIIQSISVIK